MSDITYLYIGLGFGYLSLITDAYSKLIVGYCLHPFLTAEGSLKALDMALLTRLEREEELIHHRSDFYGLCKGKGIKFVIFFAPLNDRIHSVD